MSTAIYEFGSDDIGLHFTITAEEVSEGVTKFTVNVLTGSLNLNALYWSNGDGENQDLAGTDLIGFLGTKSENSLNMNGANIVWDDDGNIIEQSAQVYDGGVKLSSAGLGQTGTTWQDGNYYLTEGGTVDFTAEVGFNVFNTLGVRATSTSTAEGSIKWVDDNPEYPPPPVEDVAFDGLSQGAWGTPDSGAGHWSSTAYTTGTIYEDIFGIDVTDHRIGGDTMLDILNLAPKGGDLDLILGKQVVAGLLNATSDGAPGEPELTADYRFSEDDIILAVKECYDGDQYDQQQKGDLANLLEFWNIAPENNHTGLNSDGITLGIAAVDGELHSTDTTDIATTLQYIKENNDGSHTMLRGGDFEGDIFQVLHDLHVGIDPVNAHGWDML